MNALKLGFSTVNLAGHLAGSTAGQLDALDFGVVEMNHQGIVLRYNATESRYSGLPAERVVGRDFFTEVAPCCNNRKVAERFKEVALEETISYTFALRMKPVPVTLRMVKEEGSEKMYLLVQWQ